LICSRHLIGALYVRNDETLCLSMKYLGSLLLLLGILVGNVGGAGLMLGLHVSG